MQYQLTDSTLSVVVNNRPHMVLRSNPTAEAVLDVLRSELSEDEQVAEVTALLNPAQVVADRVDDSRLTIADNRVLFDGENLPSSLAHKIVEIARQGLPVEPWKRFVVRLFSNPSRGAQAELNEWLEVGNLPITEDGCFLAYRRVTDDYRDFRTRTFDNSIGKVVEMPREQVDADRDRTCSTGLHFCSQDYLSRFYRGSGRIIIVKVNPADVVSIPTDYNFTKGRCCRFEVVGEVELDDEETRQEWGVYDDTYVEVDDDTDWDDPLDWEDEEEADDEEDDFYAEQADFDAFVADDSVDANEGIADRIRNLKARLKARRAARRG